MIHDVDEELIKKIDQQREQENLPPDGWRFLITFRDDVKELIKCLKFMKESKPKIYNGTKSTSFELEYDGSIENGVKLAILRFRHEESDSFYWTSSMIVDFKIIPEQLPKLHFYTWIDIDDFEFVAQSTVSDDEILYCSFMNYQSDRFVFRTEPDPNSTNKSEVLMITNDVSILEEYDIDGNVSDPLVEFQHEGFLNLKKNHIDFSFVITSAVLKRCVSYRKKSDKQSKKVVANNNSKTSTDDPNLSDSLKIVIYHKSNKYVWLSLFVGNESSATLTKKVDLKLPISDIFFDTDLWSKTEDNNEKTEKDIYESPNEQPLFVESYPLKHIGTFLHNFQKEPVPIQIMLSETGGSPLIFHFNYKIPSEHDFLEFIVTAKCKSQ